MIKMPPPDEITTDRLVLRYPTMEDAGDIFSSYATDPEVTRYLTWQAHESIEETQTFLRQSIEAVAEGTALSWMARNRPEGQLVGTVALHLSTHRASLGYLVARPFWGQGLATEMVGAVIEWAWSQQDIYRIWAVCDVDNPASARVMEKVGMEREGVLRRWMLHPNVSSEPRDCYCHALIRES